MYRLGILSASWDDSLQGWDEILAWDTRNETSYEETLHVAIASNCAYYVLFYDLCVMLLLFSDLSWDSLRMEMGWDGLVLSGWMNLLFHVSKCLILALSP